MSEKEMERRLATVLLKLARVNRQIRQDRVRRDRDRLTKERSRINMVLLLNEASQRGADEAVDQGEIRELLEAHGGDLSDEGFETLRRRRKEITRLLRDAAAGEATPLSAEQLRALEREQAALREDAAAILRDPLYILRRVRKFRRAVEKRKVEKTERYLDSLKERLGTIRGYRELEVLAWMVGATSRRSKDETLVDMAEASQSRAFLNALLDLLTGDLPRVTETNQRANGEERALEPRAEDGATGGGLGLPLPDRRAVIRAVLKNPALFRDLPEGGKIPFFRTGEFDRDLEWQRLAVSNVAAPAGLLCDVIGVSEKEVESVRGEARNHYGDDGALSVMTEILRSTGDAGLIAKILDLVEEDPIRRCRFYLVAATHADLPVEQARRILVHGDLSIDQAIAFRQRNPGLEARWA